MIWCWNPKAVTLAQVQIPKVRKLLWWHRKSREVTGITIPNAKSKSSTETPFLMTRANIHTLNKWRKQKVGVEVTKDEITDFIARNSISTRKHRENGICWQVQISWICWEVQICSVNYVEQFLRWKRRMSEVGCVERQEWETMHTVHLFCKLVPSLRCEPSVLGVLAKS